MIPTLLLTVAFVSFDVLVTRYALKKAEQRGFEKGLRMNVEETYLQGAADAENFIARVEEEVMVQRRKIWEEEIGA